MTGLALAVLIYLGAAGIWDVLEPDAVRISFGNPFRGLVAACAQIAMIALCLLVLSAAPWVYVAVLGGAFLIGWAGKRAEG